MSAFGGKADMDALGLLGCKGNEGDSMSATAGLNPTEEIFSSEVSDEALEAAAGAGNKMAASYTLFYCTALDLCPDP